MSYALRLTGTKYSSEPGRKGWLHRSAGKPGTRHGPPALYVVQVTTPDMRSWTVERTFQDFQNLWDALPPAQLIISMEGAGFPRKRHMGHENQADNVSAQAAQFAVFLDRAVAPLLRPEMRPDSNPAEDEYSKLHRSSEDSRREYSKLYRSSEEWQAAAYPRDVRPAPLSRMPDWRAHAEGLTGFLELWREDELEPELETVASSEPSEDQLGGAGEEMRGSYMAMADAGAQEVVESGVSRVWKWVTVALALTSTGLLIALVVMLCTR